MLSQAFGRVQVTPVFHSGRRTKDHFVDITEMVERRRKLESKLRKGTVAGQATRQPAGKAVSNQVSCRPYPRNSAQLIGRVGHSGRDDADHNPLTPGDVENGPAVFGLPFAFYAGNRLDPRVGQRSCDPEPLDQSAISGAVELAGNHDHVNIARLLRLATREGAEEDSSARMNSFLGKDAEVVSYGLYNREINH